MHYNSAFQQWLLRLGLQYRTCMTKPRPLEMVKANKAGPRFITDELKKESRLRGAALANLSPRDECYRTDGESDEVYSTKKKRYIQVIQLERGPLNILLFD